MAWRKSKDYDSVTSFGEGGFQTLPKGGYICRIKKAEEAVSESGKPMIHIAFDITEGEYKGYFMELFESRKARADNPTEVKYPFEGQKWIVIPDYENPEKESRQFKGFCTALEESGADIWTPDGEINVKAMMGADVGVVFQNQEQEYNGKTNWRAIPWAFRSIETIASGDFYVPDDKPLENKGYTTTYATSGYVDTAVEQIGAFTASDDEIPFN